MIKDKFTLEYYLQWDTGSQSGVKDITEWVNKKGLRKVKEKLMCQGYISHSIAVIHQSVIYETHAVKGKF